MNSATEVRMVADQIYSRASGVERLADVYIPSDSAGSPPVVIWLHGGGWRFGDRRLAPNLAQFAQSSGLAVVSIDYRLSDEAKFPAQAEDVKTAVRWLRTVASEFGLNGNKIGLWGSSAGGHLAACAALSGESEFRTGEYPNLSSTVDAVVDGYGPTNFAQIDKDRASMQPPADDEESRLVGGKVVATGDPNSFESRLLGVPVSSFPREVELADPVHYLRADGPSFLILHGEADSLVPCTQSRYLFDALNAAGIDATLALFQKLKHGFFNNRSLADADYGTVTVHRSATNIKNDGWSANPAENIPAMVCSFLQAKLWENS